MKKITALLLSVLLLAGTMFASAASEKSGDNDSFRTAQTLIFDDTISGGILTDDDSDFYKMTLSSPGKISLRFTSYMRYYNVRVFDPQGETVWYTEENEWNENAGMRSDNYTLYLEKGTYYIEVQGKNWYDSWSSSTGEYLFSVGFTSSGTTHAEPNNSFADAKGVSLYQKVVGQISEDDEYDIYRLNIPQSGTMNLRFTSYMQYYNIKLFDPDAKEIWYTEDNELNENTSTRTDNHEIYLAKGTYYIEVQGKHWYDSWSSSTGKYSFLFSQKLKAPAKLKTSATASTATLKWNPVSGASGYQILRNGKVIKTTTAKSYKVAKLKAGKAYTFTVRAYKTVNGVKYTGKSNEKVVYTKLATPKIKYAKRFTERGWFSSYHYLRVNWKKTSGAAGYEIKYAGNSKFKKAITADFSGQISKAEVSIESKKKAQYVKIRAYKYIDNVKVYSNYTKAVKAK